MNLSKLKRLPKRLSDDLKIMRLARNWSEILGAKIRQTPLRSVRLRSGVVLDSPPQVSLNFLFHEIWIDEFYGPSGYEIAPGQTVVDIGANIGVFAAWAATRARDVKVVAYEPFPATAECFRSNMAASGLACVEFHQAAVGDRQGKRTLNISDSWILHSLAVIGASAGSIEVDCVTLDGVLTDVDTCDFLKLDCEGSEYEVIYPASFDTLAKVGRIVCEFNNLDGAGRNGAGLADFLTSNGFNVDVLRPLDVGSGLLCARR